MENENILKKVSALAIAILIVAGIALVRSPAKEDSIDSGNIQNSKVQSEVQSENTAESNYADSSEITDSASLDEINSPVPENSTPNAAANKQIPNTGTSRVLSAETGQNALKNSPTPTPTSSSAYQGKIDETNRIATIAINTANQKRYSTIRNAESKIREADIAANIAISNAEQERSLIIAGSPTAETAARADANAQSIIDTANQKRYNAIQSAVAEINEANRVAEAEINSANSHRDQEIKKIAGQF